MSEGGVARGNFPTLPFQTEQHSRFRLMLLCLGIVTIIQPEPASAEVDCFACLHACVLIVVCPVVCVVCCQ